MTGSWLDSQPVRAVIPAAGLVTRFFPATRVLAKELLPLGRKPLIHHALDAETGRPCLCVRPVPMETAHRFGVAVCSSKGDGLLRVEELVEKPPRGLARSNLSVLGRYVVTVEVLDALARLAADGRAGAE